MDVDLVPFLAFFAAGAAVALPVAFARLTSPLPSLVRVNFRGMKVPAVLGDAVVVAGLTGLGLVALAEAAGWGGGPDGEVVLATVVLLVVFGVAGAWDDRKGDERPRGFKGHLGALRTGKVTGGLVKLLAGGVAGLLSGWVLFGELLAIIQTGAIVALSANLINLLDRAPGRAGKVCLAAAFPLVVWGHAGWALAGAPTLGGLAGVLALDLRERGMLGDAGSNPLGATLGLGAALSCGAGGRWMVLGSLLVLNAASERWSFSRAIDRTAPLRYLDRLGRGSGDIARNNPPE